MPSFDVVSKIDLQEIDNAVNLVQREIGNRYDFKGVEWSIENNKKDGILTIVADSDYCLEQIQGSLKSACIKRGLDAKVLDFQDVEKAGGNTLRQQVKLVEGISQENAKKITKAIKAEKMKIQASIQGDELRVSGKKRDDLQEAIQFIKGLGLEIPLQYINFRD